MNLILALVVTQYQFYHRGKLTTMIEQRYINKDMLFSLISLMPDLCLIKGLFSFLKPINLVSAINQVINQVLNSIFNLETQGN